MAAAIIAAVAGTVCYSHENKEELSDMEAANIEALADDADGLLPKWCKACVEYQDAQCQCYASIYHGYKFKLIGEQ